MFLTTRFFNMSATNKFFHAFLWYEYMHVFICRYASRTSWFISSLFPSVTSTSLPLLVYSLLQLQAPSLYPPCFTSKHIPSLEILLASALSTFYILLASYTSTKFISSLLHIQAPSSYTLFFRSNHLVYILLDSGSYT